MAAILYIRLNALLKYYEKPNQNIVSGNEIRKLKNYTEEPSESIIILLS